MSKSKSISSHTPVMTAEVLKALAVQPGGRYIDGTLGGGGHASAILERSAPGGQLLGIDADPSALETARERLSLFKESVLLVNDNFVNMQSICIKYDFHPVHGILLDLGLSSIQLDAGERGFSFQRDNPLDMRFSPTQKVSAADIVNTTPEAKLVNILRTYGEEPQANRIVQAIIRERPINTTLQLAAVVEKAVGYRGKIHPATRTFQAVRIAVNHELEYLESTLRQAVDLLGYQGRLAVISYHSLEDRIVKQFMQKEAKGCICPPQTPVCICGHTPKLKLINKKVIIPTENEIAANPRSRSAKLRVAERLAVPGEYALPEAGDGELFNMNRTTKGWRRPVLLQKIRMVFLAA
jgi:16S rRNA (cytosine1402-N4)-methyltransferase